MTFLRRSFPWPNQAIVHSTFITIALAIALTAYGQKADPSAEEQPVNGLRDAVRQGNIERVRQLLGQHPELANIPDTTDGGYPPLHWAVIDGHFEIAKLLLSKGAKVDVRDGNHGSTALFHAGSPEMARLLLENGADLNAKAKHSGETPLQNAINGRHVEVVNVFLQAGAKLGFDDAVELGDTALVAAMLKEKPWLAKPPRKPLYYAAHQGNLELCQLLIQHGADPNIDFGFSNVSGPYTPLTAAVTDGHYEIAKLFLDHGADPNVSGGRNHDNLFLFAIAYLDSQFVKSMLEHHADVQAGEHWNTGITPLHVAAALGGTENSGRVHRVGQPASLEQGNRQGIDKAKLLLEYDADVHAAAKDGSTPLLFAAIAGNRTVCELLLKNNAKLDVCSACRLGKRQEVQEFLQAEPELTKRQDLPLKRPLLLWAVQSADLAIVRLLLEHGADPNAKAPILRYEDAGGFGIWNNDPNEMETALHVAAKLGNEDIVRLLIDSKATVEAKSQHRTPLYFACYGGHEKVAKMLLESSGRLSADQAMLACSAASEYENIFTMLLDAVDKQDIQGHLGTDLLGITVGGQHKHATDVLLARGAKPDIFTAAILGRIDLVRPLLEADPALVKAKQSEYSGESVIALAVQHGQADMVTFLISKGAEFEPDKVSGKSLLHEAARHGHQKVIDLLLQRNLKLDVRTEDGATVLHAASAGAQPEIVHFLLDKGADPTAVDFSQQTPLHRLCGWSSSLDQKDDSDPTVVERMRTTARMLIDAGAIVNAKDKYSDTPLHEAAYYGRVELSELLIRAGADVNARDQQNRTPLAQCEHDKRYSGSVGGDPKAVSELLRQHGAKK